MQVMTKMEHFPEQLTMILDQKHKKSPEFKTMNVKINILINISLSNLFYTV